MKTFCCNQHAWIALAFQQSIGGNRCTHLYGTDQLRSKFSCRRIQYFPNPLNRCVPIAFRVVRQQFVSDERTIWIAGYDVSKCSATIDPKLPASRHLVLYCYLIHIYKDSLSCGNYRQLVDLRIEVTKQFSVGTLYNVVVNSLQSVT